MRDWITKQCSRPKCIDHWTATSRNDNDLINEYPLFVSAQVPLKFGDMDVASNTARFYSRPVEGLSDLRRMKLESPHFNLLSDMSVI